MKAIKKGGQNHPTPSTDLTPKEARHKDKGTNQVERFREYLFSHLATCTMVSKAIEAEQKSLTWIKRELEKNGYLWVIAKAKCRITGRQAAYLTTNPANAPKSNQLNLFENEN